MARVVDQEIVLGLQHSVEIVERAQHRDVVGVVDHRDGESVVVLEDLRGAARIVDRRHQGLDTPVVLVADHERVVASKTEPGKLARCGAVGRCGACIRSPACRRLARARWRERGESRLAALAFAPKLGEQRVERCDLARQLRRSAALRLELALELLDLLLERIYLVVALLDRFLELCALLLELPSVRFLVADVALETAGGAIEVERLQRILLDAEALLIERAEIELRARVALVGRLAIPARGARIVGRRAEPLLVDFADHGLRFRVARFRGCQPDAECGFELRAVVAHPFAATHAAFGLGSPRRASWRRERAPAHLPDLGRQQTVDDLEVLPLHGLRGGGSSARGSQDPRREHQARGASGHPVLERELRHRSAPRLAIATAFGHGQPDTPTRSVS